nr:nuclear transport factor 2 family protein [uncultured Undibacterium sp.]
MKKMMLQVFGFCLIAMVVTSTNVWAQNKRPVKEITEATKRVSESYFKAYIDREWDKLEPLLADNGRFSDPTALPVFGTVQHEGKVAAMKNFREGYAPITHMEFHRTGAMFFGEYAIFEGSLDWNLTVANGKSAVTRAMPFLTIIKVSNGLVVEHQDLADYTAFIAALRYANSGVR